MTTSAKLGRAIRRIRKAQRRTAEDLADAIGVSKVEMTRKETGQSAFSIDQVAAIAEYLHMPLPNLLREISDPHEEIMLDVLSGFAALDDETKHSIAQLITAALKRAPSKKSKA